MRIQRLVFVFALGIGLTLGLLALLQTTYAAPGDLFVMSGGSGMGCTQDQPCDLQTALGQAADGDAIYMTQGTFTGTGAAVISVTKSITLYGGWDGAPSGAVVRDPGTYPTVLDGQSDRRVVYIASTVTPTLEGLTLRNGDASGLGGDPFGFDVGGALYVDKANPLITNCHILSSSAQFGGGLALYNGAPTLVNSTVLSNVASRGGGGVYLDNSRANIVGNTVMSNTAVITGTYNGGGGLYLNDSAAQIQDNVIQDNRGYLGGGLFIYDSAALVRDNVIQSNRATVEGGATFMWLSPASLEANTILNNEASTQGGGLSVYGCAPFTLTNNVFALNRSTLGSAPALLVAGYEPLMPPTYESHGTLLHNTFAENHSSHPWMIHVGADSTAPSTTLTMTNTIIDKPGGIWVNDSGVVTLTHTLWDIDLYLQGSWAIITGPGTYISSTNIYSFTGLVWPTFHLASNSPAIDRGKNAGVTADIDGESRPNGVGYDIGADEFYCHPLTDVTITGPTMGISGTAYTFTATVALPTASRPITYTWQATGQTPLTHTVYTIDDTAVFTWTAAGDQTITVTAVNCSGGIVTDTHAMAVKWYIYLPLVVKNHTP